MAIIDCFIYVFEHFITLDLFVYCACIGLIAGAFGCIVSIVKGTRSIG